LKRIVMFTNTYHPMIGGLERSVENTHNDLNESGHLCRTITPEFKGAEDSYAGVLRLSALKGFGQREFSIPLPASSKMEHWLEAIDPQVLHSHQPFLLGETAWRVSRLRSIPLVFTHHTLYERYAHYLKVDLERAQRIVKEMTTQYANRSQIVIAPTQSVRSVLIERGVERPIEIAPSGIDWSLYSEGSRERGRRNLSLSPSDEVVGHLGRLSQEKNLNYLIEAMITLLHRRPTARFLLVGDGDRLQWAQERFEAERLSDRAVCPGMLSGTKVADAYAAMDLFAFTSHTDTQGLVLAEAMAARVPVIALDAPGARDIVHDQHEGRLLPSNASTDDFASAIDALLINREQLAAFSTQAQLSSRSYSRSACLRQLLAVYERALEEFEPVDQQSIDAWEQVAQRFDVEWTPFWEKVTTAFRALSSS
jgi:1,2-diacylglycerol 3-alpha-glucosyltransferase